MKSSTPIRLFKYLFAVLIWLCLISFMHGALPQRIISELEKARENLRISEATAERIAAELEELKASGQASPEIINDYEFYLTRVQAMVEENRRIIRGMEAAYAGHLSGKKSTVQDTSKELEGMLNSKIPEEQTVDEIAALDREFNDSLADFDEMLLKEFDGIRARSAEKMRDLTEEAAEAAERLREQGVDLNGSESETPSDAEEGAEDGEPTADMEKEGTDKEKGSDFEEGSVDREGTSRDEPGEGDPDSSREQKRPYDKGDDDIVARQLREAAENETDPELKEKLWKEYEAYKKNSR
ncbi:MAG: hypothetical protein JRG75_12710 [Deltaproteobacteria bacterium]|nr:hypothetical protein [Deltaproteobacteria bacterium]